MEIHNDIEGVLVTSTGGNGWCGQCDTLKIEHDRTKLELDSLKKEVGLILARDTIAEMVAIVYGNIKFKYEGHSIFNYSDACSLRCRLKDENIDLSRLDKAVVASVVKFLGDSTLSKAGLSKVGSAFNIITRFKGRTNCEVHCQPDLKAVITAIEFYCTNTNDIADEKKKYSEECFLIFAKKACASLEQEIDYESVSSELDS